MRLTDLQNKPVCTMDGKRLGRVHDVHCENGVLIALKVGPGGFIERMTAKTNGRRIPWDQVAKVERERIVVAASPQRRKSG